MAESVHQLVIGQDPIGDEQILDQGGGSGGESRFAGQDDFPRRMMLTARTLAGIPPDNAQTVINIGTFPSSLEGRREVWTAYRHLGRPERWSDFAVA